MKKTHIFGILVIALAIIIIISTAQNSSAYVSFTEAFEMSQAGNSNNIQVPTTCMLAGNSNNIHVVGTLKKDNAGNIVGIRKGEDKTSFSFIMVDENRKEQLVFYKEPMPADFTKSEQVVVVGQYKQDIFVADEILMKCPSKYVEENPDFESTY